MGWKDFAKEQKKTSKLKPNKQTFILHEKEKQVSYTELIAICIDNTQKQNYV